MSQLKGPLTIAVGPLGQPSIRMPPTVKRTAAVTVTGSIYRYSGIHSVPIHGREGGPQIEFRWRLSEGTSNGLGCTSRSIDCAALLLQEGQ